MHMVGNSEGAGGGKLEVAWKGSIYLTGDKRLFLSYFEKGT